MHPNLQRRRDSTAIRGREARTTPKRLPRPVEGYHRIRVFLARRRTAAAVEDEHKRVRVEFSEADFAVTMWQHFAI